MIGLDYKLVAETVSTIRASMLPAGRAAADDTLFLGGATLTDGQVQALGRFAESKNYKIVFAEFEPGSAEVRDITAIVTDGVSQTTAVRRGQLWKPDGRQRAEIVFSAAGIAVDFQADARIRAQPASKRHKNRGFEVAKVWVKNTASRQKGVVPVVTSLGGVATITDAATMLGWLEEAA